MTTKQLILTGIVLVVIVVIVGIVGSSWGPTQQPPATASTKVTPPSPEVIAQVQASKGFQELVSYTDAGFEPSTLAIKKGETVRFGNNSSHDMWIVDTLHPDTSVCNTTILNSCKALKPGEFWEHTFATANTIQYMDKMNTTNTGIIKVK